MPTLTKPKLRDLRVCAKSLSLLIGLALLLNGALPVLAVPPPPPSPQPVAKLSGALRSVLSSDEFSVWSDPMTGRLRVLIQGEGPVSAGLLTAVTLSGGFVVRQFTSINGVLADIPKSSLLNLAARTDVERISADHLSQQSTSHLEISTGADAARSAPGGSDLDGSGIGIAILDSGIMSNHGEFTSLLGLSSRVVASTDIVSSNTHLALVEGIVGVVGGLLGGLLPVLGSNKDGYGHGSHVASIAAGRASGRNYDGIAPGAHLIDVRVLDGRGLGQTSDVIAGVDWVLANRTARNIRVMNLSLGAGSSESWETDPLCRAVRRAVAAGITVVAAAGNYGQSPDGLERYGSITAPGNDPSVITVGAANTHQTNGRGDESVTYFSSRGPTRGYSIDESNVKHYDNLLKPDLIAPGNRIIAAESNRNWLVAHYPQLHVTGSGSGGFMQLSGTSVAAPAVAGAAALLLEKNPGLTPPLAKAILQYTAQQLTGSNICQQGAGLLNIEGAVRLAGALRTDIASKINSGTINVGDSLLRPGATFPSASSTVAGSNFPWGGYIFAGGSHVLAGAELFKRYQAIYNPALVWVRDKVTIDDSPAANCALISEGVINADAIAASGVFTTGAQLTEGIAAGQGIIFCEGIIFAEGIVFCEGIIFAEGIIFCEGIIFAEGIIFCEGIIFAEGSDMGEGIIFCESFSLGEP